MASFEDLDRLASEAATMGLKMLEHSAGLHDDLLNQYEPGEAGIIAFNASINQLAHITALIVCAKMDISMSEAPELVNTLVKEIHEASSAIVAKHAGSSTLLAIEPNDPEKEED
jgi:hypothetical protein